MVAERLGSEDLQTRWQTVLITFGFALLALGLPTTRLLGEGPNLVRWTQAGAWVHVHLALLPIARLLAPLPKLGPERAWSLIAALSWAATYPVLHATCIGLGTSRATALVAAAVSLAAPAAWLAGTLPGPSATGLLGSAVIMYCLLGPWMDERAGARRVGPQHWVWVWFAACLANLTLVLLYPAVAWAVLASRRRGDERGGFRNVGALAAAPLLLVGALAAAGWLLPTTVPQLEFLRKAWYLITGNTDQPISSAFAWALILAPSLGVGALGLWHLVERPVRPDEGSRPGWLLAWCVVPFVFQIWLGRPNLDLATIVLGPVITVGLADWLSSQPEDSVGTRYQLLCVSQLVVLVSFGLALARGDPDREWTNMARDQLTSSDLVLTRSRSHDYLLEHRFRVESVHLNEPRRLPVEERPAWWHALEERVAAAAKDGRRVLIDRANRRTMGVDLSDPDAAELQRVLLAAPVYPLRARN